jgi:hypothetical protein
LLSDHLDLIQKYWKLGVAALVDLFLLAIFATKSLLIPSGVAIGILIALISFGYISYQSSKYGGFSEWRIAMNENKRQGTIQKIKRDHNLRRIRLQAEERADSDGQTDAGPFRKGSTTRYPSSSVYSYRSQQSKIPIATLPCKDCEGKGRIEVVIRQNLVGANEVKSFPCNKCQGSGYVAAP